MVDAEAWISFEAESVRVPMIATQPRWRSEQQDDILEHVCLSIFAKTIRSESLKVPDLKANAPLIRGTSPQGAPKALRIS
jgi:hypothetical protein